MGRKSTEQKEKREPSSFKEVIEVNLLPVLVLGATRSGAQPWQTTRRDSGWHRLPWQCCVGAS